MSSPLLEHDTHSIPRIVLRLVQKHGSFQKFWLPLYVRCLCSIAMHGSRQFQCEHSVNSFCYVCGDYRTPFSMRTITPKLRELYAAYFRLRTRDEKPWAPSKVCITCFGNLIKWSKKERDSMPFGVPMLWSEPSNHEDDCYFCAARVKGINKYNRKEWDYPDVKSARRPQAHSDQVDVPLYENPEAAPSGVDDHERRTDDFFPPDDVSSKFSQGELNDLIRDLALPKKYAELLASRLREKNLLELGRARKPIRKK